MLKLKGLTGAIVPLLLVLVAGVGIVLAANTNDRIPEGTPVSAPSGEGWIDLLSEENAPYWENVTNDRAGIFNIEDGIFHIPGADRTHYVSWMKQDFGDFKLHAEFKLASGTNSGIFFRSDPKNPVYGGMEIQVYDDYRKPPSKYSTGSLYDIATPMFNMARPAGEWNSYEITCQGSMVEVVINGWKVLDLDLSKMTMPIGKFDTPLAELPQKGHIILQDHGGEIWYRNVLVKPL